MASKAVLIILLSLIISSFSFSQTPASDPETVKTQNANISRKTDEFGYASECDLRGRMDNFLVELQNEPESKGYIIFYQGKDALPAHYNTQGRKIYLTLVKLRKFDESRIVLINSFREERVTEFWIVPPGGEIPQPTNTIEAPKIPENETYLYDSRYLQFYYELYSRKFLLQTVMDKFSQEDKEFFDEQEKAAGETSSEEEMPGWLSPSFIEQIINKKNSKGIILFYVNDETYDVNKVRNQIEKAVSYTAKEEKIDRNRLKIIYGGYRSDEAIEMWVVPKNGKMPERQPDKRPVKEPDTIDN